MPNINPMAIMELQQKFNVFKQEHPRVLPFFNALKDNTPEVGSVFDMKVTNPDGTVMQCNIKLTENDLEMFRTLMNLKS